MKKLLIGLTILFSFLMFLDNVSAETNYIFDKDIYFVNLYGMTYDEMYNTISEYYSDFKSEDQIIKIASFYSGIYNYFVNNYGEDYYVYSGYATNGYPAYNYEDMYTVKKSSVSNLKFALTVNDYGKIIVSSNLSTWKESIFSVDTTNKTISLLRSNTNQKIAYFMNTDKTHSSGYINNCHFYLSNIDKNFIYSTSLLTTISYNMDGGVGTVVETITMNGKTYSNSDEIFLVNEGLQISEPQLEYKTGFISSEAYSVLGKVTNNFSIDSDLLEYRNYKFKLQFGSNDFTNENIPLFSHYKIFGLNRGTNNWEVLDKYLTDNFFTLNIIDTTYDYSEGMLADASITLQLNYNGSDEELEIFNTLYSQIKLEFYLDNTQNGYIYCYDNLSSSKWEDTSKFLENYIYYYFPSNYKYAFITSDNNINEGKIYFPTNSINNDLVKIQGQYYNLKNKNFSFPIITNLYLNDSYYSYFDFYFNDTENILLLNRAVGSYNYESWYNPTFLEHWYENILIDYISISEDTYFYVPIGYNVYFTNNTNITINTSNGNIDIDIENIKNDYENNIYNDNITNNSFFDSFIKSFNYFISPINNLFSLISLFFSILPIGIQYMFYVSFGFIIALLIYKFVL